MHKCTNNHAIRINQAKNENQILIIEFSETTKRISASMPKKRSLRQRLAWTDNEVKMKSNDIKVSETNKLFQIESIETRFWHTHTPVNRVMNQIY